MCTGTAVPEFSNILFKARGEIFEHIQTYFNDEICIITDENYDEVRAWIENNKKRKLEGQGYPVTFYSRIFLPSYIRPPPERSAVDKLVFWNSSGIQILDSLARVKLHKRGWEYAELLHDNVMKEVKHLIFGLFGKESVWV